MYNKIHLELLLPIKVEGKEEEVAKCLVEQTQTLVRIWKDALNYFKIKGVPVPTLSVRGVTSSKKESNGELKEFKKKLLDHLLIYQPKVSVPGQIKAITELFGLNKPAEHWIDLFEESRQSYPLTTWRTVKYKLTKASSNDDEFERKVLQEDEVETIRNRIAGYGKN